MVAGFKTQKRGKSMKTIKIELLKKNRKFFAAKTNGCNCNLELIEYVDGTLDTIEIGTEHKAKMGFRILKVLKDAMTVKERGKSMNSTSRFLQTGF